MKASTVACTATFLDTGLVGDLGYDFCFGHVKIFLKG
jgi:hypothetical protein